MDKKGEQTLFFGQEKVGVLTPQPRREILALELVVDVVL